MRSSWKTLVAVAAGLWLAPQLAAASSDVEEQLQAMQDRMAQLEDKLQAQTDQLGAAEQRVADQAQLLQDSGFSEDSTGSALSRFLEMTEFGGNMAVSYNYNFNSPHAANLAGANTGGFGGPPASVVNGPTGGAGFTAPFHSNANTFQIDQLLFTMENASTEQSPAGFRLDLAHGISADALSAVGASDGNLSFLYQAYVSYLIGGVEIDAGRYETIVGAEVFQVDQNFNITRGLVYALQPTSHTGILLSGDIGDGGVSWAAGFANDTITNTQVDGDTDKEFMAQLAWTGETSSLSTSFIRGDAGIAGKNSDTQTLIDVVATWDPSDQLSVWANYDYYFLENDGGGTAGRGFNGNLWGLAVASRYGFSDTTGAALRGEVIDGGNGDKSAKVWSLTGTVDHALTDNLKGLLELRWDKASQAGSNNSFINDNRNGGVAQAGHGSQWLALAQLVYSF